jgi:hypothetical protein
VGGDSTPVGDDGPVSTTVGDHATTTVVPAVSPHPGAGLLQATWSLEASYGGWLMDPVPFDGGYAAIRKTEPRREFWVETEGDEWETELLANGEVSRGDVWMSSDGVEWAPAASQPPEQPWMLVSDGDTLFAGTGNLYAGGGTIWASGDGSEWRPALAPGEYHRLLPMSGWGWGWFEGALVAGPPGAVAFGVGDDGALVAWFFDGDRFVPSDVTALDPLPPDADAFQITVLADRLLLATLDSTRYESQSTMKVSSSADGAVWSALDAKPDPLARPDASIESVASHDGLSLAGLSTGYGLWATRDGSSWGEVVLRPSGNGWVPQVAAGEYGWVVFSPARKESALSSLGEFANLGLWYSPDGITWSEVDSPNPRLGHFEARSMAVRDDHVLLFGGVDTGPGRGWGVPSDPATEVWRLDLTPVADAAAITVSFGSVEGLEGFVVTGRVLADDGAVLGSTATFGRHGAGGEGVAGAPIGAGPFTAADVVRRPATDGTVGDGLAAFAPGSYRLRIEALDPSGTGRFGCEIPIEVVAGAPLEVTITDLPDFAGGGDRWMPGPDGRSPPCSDG